MTMATNLSETRIVDPGTAALASAGFNLVGNMISQSSANDKNVELQRETNKRNFYLALMQNAYNKYMVDYANEYDSYKNQMARMIDAGSSPYAAASALSSSQSNILQSAPMANQVAPQVQPIDLGTSASLLGQNSIASYNAETERYKADTDRMNVEKDMSYKDKLMNQIDEQVKLLQSEIDKNTESIALMRSEKEKNVATKDYQELVNTVYRQFGKRQAEAEVNKLVSEFDLNKENEKLIRNQIYYNSQMLKFQLLASMRDYSRVLNESMTTINTLKLGDSLRSMQDSVTALNRYDLKNMKPLELKLLENTARYDRAHKFFSITRDFITTFNQTNDFVHDPLGIQRNAKDVLKHLK